MQQQLKEAFGAGQASTAWMHLDLMVLLVPFKLRVFYDFFLPDLLTSTTS